jgi:hypothetical protein
MKRFFARRDVLALIGIFCCITFCLIITGFGIFSECISNYNNVMPIYEGAELVESESSLLNYMGLGELRTIWFVESDAEVVQQWYRLTLADMRQAQRDAVFNGTEVPPLWDGEWDVIAVDGGSQILMEAPCF